MRLDVNEFDAVKSGKELDLMDLDSSNIVVDLKWWPFKEEFLNMAKTVMGVDNEPPYYVIRTDQPVGWVPQNAIDQRMYQLPHTKYVYNMDKKMVWLKILKYYLNNPSR